MGEGGRGMQEGQERGEGLGAPEGREQGRVGQGKGGEWRGGSWKATSQAQIPFIRAPSRTLRFPHFDT